MVDRLFQFIESEGISVRSFEERIGASNGVVSKAIKNGTDIQSKWLYVIGENFPHLDLNWLITGKGDMLKDQTINSESALLLSAIKKRDEQIDDLIEMLKDQVSSKKENAQVENNVECADVSGSDLVE